MEIEAAEQISYAEYIGIWQSDVLRDGVGSRAGGAVAAGDVPGCLPAHGLLGGVNGPIVPSGP